MHYYDFNIADYRKDTAHLKPIEHYIYRTLIDWYYLDETPIPKITQVVMRRLSLGSDDDQKALLNVLGDFFDEQDDGFHHLKIDSIIESYHFQNEKNRENGKKGGRPPKNNPNKSETKPKQNPSVISDNPNQSETNPNQEPITNNQEPITKDTQSNLIVEILDDDMPDVCRSMRELGVTVGEQRQNHDKITALVRQGATIEHFAAGLSVAAEQGKGFAFALGVVRNRLADEAKPQQARASPKSGRMTRDDYANVPDASLADAVRKQNELNRPHADDGRTLEAPSP